MYLTMLQNPSSAAAPHVICINILSWEPEQLARIERVSFSMGRRWSADDVSFMAEQWNINIPHGVGLLYGLQYVADPTKPCGD